MLFSLCQGPCGKLLPAEQITETVLVENHGFSEEKKVCQACYFHIINDDSNTLLLEQE